MDITGIGFQGVDSI